MLKLIFLIVGLAALIGIILHIGIEPILHTVSQLGLFHLGFILLPMIVVYGLEALGWQVTLGPHARKIGFLRLFAIRMAGETVNVTTPTAYVGGEPLKAYLLKRYGVPMVDGLASVITAKTTMTLAQVFFILLGLALTFWIIGESGSLLGGDVGECGSLSVWSRALCAASTAWHRHGLPGPVASVRHPAGFS